MPRRAAAENVVKLTTRGLRELTLGPGQSERVVWDEEVRGLGYRLRRSGSATWVIRAPRAGGRSSLYSLGPADALDLGAARKAARERMAAATLGDDPHAARRERRARAARCVGETFDLYTAWATARHRPSTLANLRTHLSRHWKPLRTYPLAAVSRADVAARLNEIATEFGPHASTRARRTLSAIYAWSIAEGLCETNPVEGTRAPADDVRRDRVLSDHELAAVWRACSDDDFGWIVRLLILTAQRREEVAGMRWSELDLAGAMWRLPSKRTKNGRAHTVPLSAAALAILETVPARQGRDLLFGQGAGSFSGMSKPKKRLDAAIKLSAPWHIHDLRRSTATGLGKRCKVLPHVVEAVLNHVSGFRAGVAGIYNLAEYDDEKRAALDIWAEHILGLQAGSDKKFPPQPN